MTEDKIDLYLGTFVLICIILIILIGVNSCQSLKILNEESCERIELNSGKAIREEVCKIKF